MDDKNQLNNVPNSNLSGQPSSVPPVMPSPASLPVPPQPPISMPGVVQSSIDITPASPVSTEPVIELPTPPAPPVAVPTEPIAPIAATSADTMATQPTQPVFTSLENQPVIEEPKKEDVADVALPAKKKNKVLPIIISVVAVLLITGVAGASYFVSKRLSSQTAVAPTAPTSKPMAGGSCCGSGCCAGAKSCCPEGEHCSGGRCVGSGSGGGGGGGGGGDCFSNGCSSGKCCVCKDGRETSGPNKGNCKGGSGNSWCDVCGNPNADVIHCGSQTCDPGDECCGNGCKSKGGCDTPKTNNNEACYYDTRGDINGKEVKAGTSIHVAGWGGICRDNKLLADRVDVHICNDDGTNCSALKGSIKRNDRSESGVQTGLCTSNVPGKPNTLGFDDYVAIPSTITLGKKRVKVVVVSADPATKAQLTKWCEDPVFTLTAPPLECNSWTSVWINDCTPETEYSKTPRTDKCKTTNDSVTLHISNAKATQMRFRSAKNSATLCTDTDDAKFNAWTAWEAVAATKQISISQMGGFTGDQFKVCAQFKDATSTSVSCGSIIEKGVAPACTNVKVAVKSGTTWTKINTSEIATKVHTGDTIRLYAAVSASVAKTHFRVTLPDNTMLFDPAWKEGTKEGSDFFVEFTITKSGAYTFEAEVQ